MGNENIGKVSDRVLILEIESKAHKEEMKELKEDTKILQKGLSKINVTISQIRNIILGSVFVLLAQEFGILSVLKKIF